MHEYVPANEKKARTLDVPSGTSRQAPIQAILQGRQPPDTEVMQRMILPLWTTPKDRKDFLKQAEIQSRDLNHGKIINLSNLFTDKNLSKLGEFEDLHIIGHGSPQTVAGMSPEGLADLVVHELKLPAAYKGRIYLETCESGTKPATLEGSYAARFIQAVNALRGEASSPLSAVGFAGTLVLDKGMPGRTVFRILKEDVTMEKFKTYAEVCIADSADIVKIFVDELQKQGLADYMDLAEIPNLLFYIYNAKISPYAELQGGGRTKLYIWGTEYQGLPDAEPVITDIMDQIKTKAEAEKASMENIPVIKLDLGDLKLEVKK